MIQGEATFIFIVKWIVFLFASLIFALVCYLVWLNRDSEKVISTVLPAVALGLTGILITVLFGLKEEVREVEFPALFTYERPSLIPFGIARNVSYSYLPHSERLAAGHLEYMRNSHPEVFTKEITKPGMDIYGDIALRLVFDSLFQIFANTWNVKVTKNLPILGQRIGGVESPKSLMRWSDLPAIFPNSYAIKAPAAIMTQHELGLPPGTKLTGKEERSSNGAFSRAIISLVNDFVDMEITITLRGGAAHIGTYRLVVPLPEDQIGSIWTASYHVEMNAKFSKYRSGHPDMPKYQAWVDNVFETVRDLLDSQRQDEKIVQEIETQLGTRIDKVENSLAKLHDKSDKILSKLPK